MVAKAKFTLDSRKLEMQLPCIENCDLMTAEERAMYDFFCFQELREVYEPYEVDYSEDNAREKVFVEVYEWGWVRIELELVYLTFFF